MIDKTKTIKSGQEQAVASWINYLNQVRLNQMNEVLKQEQSNLNKAMATINKTLKEIDIGIVHNGKGRGGTSGMRGFIAEASECGISNAREQIVGKAPIYTWINDDGPIDLSGNGLMIQMKFSNSGSHLSLHAIRQHLHMYPYFLDEDGVYVIPKDHYDKIQWLLSIPEEKANKMPTSTGEFSLKQWKEVHEFFEEGDIPLEKVKPSKLRYDEVQKDTYEETFSKEVDSLKKTNKERVGHAREEAAPKLSEGIKATVVSAGIEGASSLCLEINKKRKEGKKLKDFNGDDWKDIAGATGTGTLKGGIRGASIYTLTNYSATPAAVASAIVTASFGVADQVYQLKQGQIDEQTFIENSETLCLDASISALSSFAGQVLIPVPVIGAVIGNTVGTMMYQIAKDNFSSYEQKIFEEYKESIYLVDKELNEQYQEFVDEMGKDMQIFMELLDKAFAPDISLAFEGSIELAKSCGVPTEEILVGKDKLTAYFLD